MTDNKSAHFWPAMAETFAARGMSTLRFDFSGNGESEGEFRYGNILLEVCLAHSSHLSKSVVGALICFGTLILLQICARAVQAQVQLAACNTSWEW